MCAKYFARNAAASMAAVDTEYALQGDGAGNTVNDIVVPAGKSKITSIDVSIGADATAGDSLVFVIIGGDGVVGPSQTICVGAVCTVGTSVGFSGIALPSIPVDIPVTPGGTIVLKGVMGGSDLGDPTIKVGLEVA